MPRGDFPSLYAILDVDAVSARGWLAADVCRVWLDAGIRLIQLRAKSLPSGAFLDLADACVLLCHEAAARLVINDRADIAAMSGADGTHVGQDDLTVADVRRVMGAAAMVGLSTHSEGQLRQAVGERPTYVAIGPVFGTRTKDTGYGALGLDAVRRAAQIAHAAGLPLAAIGGITRDRAAETLGAGADSLAVISDLLDAPDLPGLAALARTWVSLAGSRDPAS
jgi:thiamine-phosphate pyrophosphorylase